MPGLLTESYQCPECYATFESHAVDMCDFCILKFFADNPNEKPLGW